jgi:hypothetical protein
LPVVGVDPPLPVVGVVEPPDPPLAVVVDVGLAAPPLSVVADVEAGAGSAHEVGAVVPVPPGPGQDAGANWSPSGEAPATAYTSIPMQATASMAGTRWRCVRRGIGDLRPRKNAGVLGEEERRSPPIRYSRHRIVMK